MDDNEMLEYAVFHASPPENSYEALACTRGNTEEIASGPLDQLALYLSEAKGCQSSQSATSFKLQFVEGEKRSSWFTKGTLARFLHIVNAHEALKISNAIEEEMTQLEETKKFHISLYAKDQDKSTGRTTDISSLKEVGVTQQIKVETTSSDATKNELLRALDLRLAVLEDELAASFNRAAGATCSTQQISDLSEFAEHFGATDLRNFLLNLLARRPKNQPFDVSVSQRLSLQDMRNSDDNTNQDILDPAPQTVVKPVKDVALAKIAQAERQSSSESEESSESSDEDQSRSERSRSLVRSATPRRSASPMRRIQIGRSGSRRAASLTIKSLGHFPARERTASMRDADGSNNGDEEPDQLVNKPENPVRTMSVQDAISLFESKQKDQRLDFQKKKAPGEVSTSTTAKSVLRRWSAGMGDSFGHTAQENVSDAASQEAREESKPAEANVVSNIDESPQAAQSSADDSSSVPVENPIELAAPKVEEVIDRTTTTAEWSRQKEAELNQMMMKMMEIKPGKQRGVNGVDGIQQDVPNERRGGLYGQYREKRDEKLRAENAGKRAVKEAQIKVMKEGLEQSKAQIAAKSMNSAGRRDSPNHSQKPRRNSSPPLLAKKEVSKPAGTGKALSKTSPLPATRNSWSAGSLPKASGSLTPKTPSGPVVTNSTSNRRKPSTTPSTTQPSPRAERLQHTKVKKGTPPDAKPNLRSQEEKMPRSVTKSSKSSKSATTKSLPTLGDDSSALQAKPSFYNKVTKKSSVVPLESKPFLKRGTGIAPRGSPMATKAKVSRPDDPLKNSGNVIQPPDNESSVVMTESNAEVLEVEYVKPADTDADASLEEPLEKEISHNQTENCDHGKEDLDNGFKSAVELPVPEIQADEDVGISSAAWVEVEHEEGSTSCDSGMPSLTISPELASAETMSSPRVRHSLSQMLQADNNEPEIIEWGNAENPPALVYQKDAPKGFKRLLKFARKSKGEANVAGWASPSMYSEGEDDTEDSKAASKRSSDAVLRKVALQAKGYEPPKSMFSGSFDGANPSKRSMDQRGMNEFVPVQSSGGTATILDRLREGQSSASTTSTKATRSFFSLSTFRSNKSSETKLR